MKISKKKNNPDSYRNSVENKKFMSKKLVVGCLMLLLTVGAFAQKERRGGKMSDLTPDQMAELQTKKMALDLDLTEAQQKKVYDLNKEQAIEREAKRKEMMALREKGEKPDDKNSFERKKTRLVAQLEHQNELKKILNDSQFETWKKSKKHKAHKMKKMRKDGKMKKHQKGKKRKEKRGQEPEE
ncbi:hypothetical protein UMM65_08300 [Aureibaculum sp. 2210JD6-5]|uniref:hypothetical protein n=1 Tax=Aureibaculum sp. 2210JD6-5 TaxID=3103957 RepID=UPI002AAC5FF9|nr:hypothetical protein [Aureibaculum sp. 2210JD6-5]MDY7395241.1 hypothetical protein [Aureibaculum sp. 2210JD6-5]